MNALPVMFHLAGRRCVIAGGGAVARRRAAALLDAGAEVLVVAPDVCDELAAMPIRIERRAYQADDLTGALLVVIATDDGNLNRQIAGDARDRGVLVNQADDPEASDITMTAHQQHGCVTIAVHTGGASASAAVAICRELSDALDADWPILLERVIPWRRSIQEQITDAKARQAALRQLTSADAMTTLKQHGQAAFDRYCQQVLDRHRTASAT